MDDIRRTLDEIAAHQKRAPPLWSLVVAFIVPMALSLVAGGRIIRQVDENEEILVRQEKHIEAIDDRIGLLEQRAAVTAVILELGSGHANVVQAQPEVRRR